MGRVIFLLALAAVTFLRCLPLGICYRFGQFIGMVLWGVLPRYRRLARANMTIAFGDDVSEAEIRRMVRRHFQHLGANACCAFKLSALTEDEILACCRGEHFERLRAAMDRGRGVVMAISHIGNWELLAQLTFFAPDIRCGTVYQSMRNKAIDDLVNGERRRRGVATFDRKRDLGKALALVRDGGLVGVLVDQHAGDSGIWTPFFGKLASTSPLAASLSLRTGAAVVPVAIFTDGFAKWRLVVSEEVETEGTDERSLTLRINRALEAQIRESPPDWFWVHNRWKLPHPQFLLSGAKRGIYLPTENDEAMRLKPLRIVVRSSNWLGDAVMSSLAVRAIKFGRPDVKLTILTREKLADFWRSVPGVDDVIAIAEDAGVWKVASKIRGRFDVAVVFPNSTRTALEAWLGGVPRRVGYPGDKREFFLNQIVRSRRKSLHPEHQVKHYLRIATRIGAPTVPLEFPRARPPAGPLRIGLCPGAEYGSAKRWLPSRYRTVMEKVSEQLDCTWVILGVAKDEPIAAEILSGFDGRYENLVGRTSLNALIAELRTQRTLLTNDTGTMHLAVSLGIPVVALFGSTEPRLTGPLGDHHTVIRHQVECSPCFQRECPLDFRCMRAIEPDEVAAAVIRSATLPFDDGAEG